MKHVTHTQNSSRTPLKDEATCLR